MGNVTLFRTAAGLALCGMLAGGAAPPACAESRLRDIRKLSVLSEGGGHQVLFYNYTRQTMSVSHYSTVNSGVPYLLMPGETVGAFLYDYWAGKFTEAVYAAREPES